jgi:hypothetical protein
VTWRTGAGEAGCRWCLQGHSPWGEGGRRRPQGMDYGKEVDDDVRDRDGAQVAKEEG